MPISSLTSFSSSDFTDLSRLMSELSSDIVLAEDSLKRMLDDSNSHLYVIREDERIVACACLCIYYQPFQTDGTIESVVVASNHRGKGLGRELVEHIIKESRQMGVEQLHLTSNPQRVAANGLYQKMGFVRKETNCYVKVSEVLEVKR